MNGPLLVTKETLSVFWPQIAKVLQPAVDLFDGFTIEDHKHSVFSGRAHVWIGADDNEIKVAAICTIIVYPRKKTYLLQCLSGTNMKDWAGFLPKIEEFAMACGCKDIEVSGRKGWSRIEGFELTEYVCRKQIGGE